MKTYTRSKIFIWVIIGLIIINLSTVATVIYHIRQTKKDISIQTDTLYSKMPVREYSKFLIECLEFNDEQAREFNKINNLYKRKAHDITQQMMKIRRAMIQEIVKAESDSLILTDLAEKLGDNHAQLKKLTINYLLSIKNICTPEQRDKLIPLYKKMLSPEPYQRRTFDRKKYGNRFKKLHDPD